MADGLSSGDIRSLAVFLTGRWPADELTDVPELTNICATADAIRLDESSWNGWSPDLANTRFQARSVIKPNDVHKLKVKWTFAYRGSKNTQVTVIGDRLFVASTTGEVYSLNARTGCVYWRYLNAAGVRAAMPVGKLAGAPSGYALYVSDLSQTVHALDAVTGKLLWSSRKLEEHPRAHLTAAAALYDGTLYVPISSGEETAGAQPAYACCTFRGSVVALDVVSGNQRWKTYTIDEEPKTLHEGMQQMGPAGAAVWAAPTVDAKRSLLYVATADSYTAAPTDRADAILALDLKSGAVRWSKQVTQNDNFVLGCDAAATPRNPNCPTPMGPDHDFGSSPILRTLGNGKDIIVAGQKSGVVYGFDPEASGNLLWTTKVGQGGLTGGVEWGMASDADTIYVPINDVSPPGTPGLSALNLRDGAVRWAMPTPRVACAPDKHCLVGQAAPASAIPGVAFSGALDGHLRAYDSHTGRIIWDFDTSAVSYETVNGVHRATGGVLNATGPSFSRSMMFLHSGYHNDSEQNLLMAFSVNAK
jgi:polyvinyl alcohol dehydrogenase (cytochrome)